MKLDQSSTILKFQKVTFGLLLILFSLFTLISVITFSPEDPSVFNAVNYNTVKNRLGYYGALFSDVFIQLYGFASIFIAVFVGKLGYDTLRNKQKKLLIFKFLTLPLIIVISSFLLTPVALPETFIAVSGGGWLGKFLYDSISQIIDIRLVYSGSIFLFFVLFILIFDIKPSSVAKVIFTILYMLFSRFKSLENKNHVVLESEVLEYQTHQEEEEIAKQNDARAAKKRFKTSKEVSNPVMVKLNKYQLPQLDLLNKPKQTVAKISQAFLQEQREDLETVLKDFGIKGSIVQVKPGPVVTLYELEPAAGTKSSRIIGLADDIARSMSALSARIAVIPGRNLIGIELPNKTRETVFLREMVEANDFKDNSYNLPIALGKNIGGDPVIVDLAKMPHLLVAGTTGSGKSVAINVMILSFLYKLTPEQCRFIMIDPKMLELSVYDGIPHLLTPVVTEPTKAVAALKWVVKEMENRYRLMSGLGVRNIHNYNERVREAKNNNKVLTKTIQTGFDSESGHPIFETKEIDSQEIPFIVVIVDEMADLMIVAGKDIESSVQRLAQMARAAGIHIIMATQRPSVDVITGVIKANFPTRISFQVTSKIDSRTILGEQGAEQLLGMGDMLYMAGGSKIMRVHAPFVSDSEVENVVKTLKAQSKPEYNEDILTNMEEAEEEGNSAFGGSNEEGDELYNEAVSIIVRDRKASTSYIQRSLRIGYNRAANLIDRMEREGVVGPANHVGKREILVKD